MRDDDRWSFVRELAFRAHVGQDDDDGPHFAHVERVAQATPEFARRVAYLHDVLEDTDVPESEVFALLPTQPEREALLLLTRSPLERGTRGNYDRYVDRIVNASGPAGHIARTVKWHDATDNRDRCRRSTDPQYKALEKRYEKTLLRLVAGRQD